MGPNSFVEEARPAGVEKRVEPLQVGRVPDPAGGLLGLGGRLLVVGQEEEGPVARQRPTHRRAELVPPEVGFSAAPIRGVLGGDLVPLAEVVGRAGQLVGTRLGDDVDEPAGRAAELRGSALVHDDQFTDRVLVEGERGTLAAALLAEEGIVEVGAVHDEVVEDAALAVDVQLVAVRPLGNGGSRRQEGQVHKIAAVAGQRVHHLFP